MVSSELDESDGDVVDVPESDVDDSDDDELDVDQDRFFGLRTCLFLSALNFKPCGISFLPRLKVTAVGALALLCLETVSPCPALLIDDMTSLKPVGRTGCFTPRFVRFSRDFPFLSLDLPH